MTQVVETVHNGRDNEIDLALLEDNVTFGDHTTITRAILEFGGGRTHMSPAPYLTIDSDADPSYFDFTDTEKLILRLGAASIPKGRHQVKLIIYTSAFTNGAAWEPRLELDVR